MLKTKVEAVVSIAARRLEKRKEREEKRTEKKGKEPEKKGKEKGTDRNNKCSGNEIHFIESREHVAIRECFVATQPHDVWLILMYKWAKIIGKKNAQFLPLSPAWTMFIQEVVEEALIWQSEGISGDVLPTKI